MTPGPESREEFFWTPCEGLNSLFHIFAYKNLNLLVLKKGDVDENE
jgi:hypothetical protein